jgi:hypothetical protein
MIVATLCTRTLLFIILSLSSRSQTSLAEHPNRKPNLPDAPSSVVRFPERPKSEVPRSATGATQRFDEAWPRKAVHGEETISMYQPQLEAWESEELRAYAALAFASKTHKTTKYGVVWFTARTEVDKVNRQVTLNDVRITKVNFPTMQTKESEYQAFLQAKLPGKFKVIALDRLEAALAACESEAVGVEAFEVNDDPPKIIFADKPSLLALIDGPPQYRDVRGTNLEMMLNTKATILLDTKQKEYYLNVMDGWLHACFGPRWSVVVRF